MYLLRFFYTRGDLIGESFLFNLIKFRQEFQKIGNLAGPILLCSIQTVDKVNTT